MKQLIIIILIGISGCKQQSSTTNIIIEVGKQSTDLSQTEILSLDSVNIDFQFKGDCYAYSSMENAEKSNGEAHSDNLPKKINKSFPKQGLYLVINQNEFSKIDSTILGCKLYLVNTTDTLLTLNASDSRLYIVAEALNNSNEWLPISYLPSSWCGNSYHNVILDKDEYWSFNIPIFKGSIKTKLRYTLTINKEKKISSNEVIAYLNKGQFDKERKEGSRNSNIMNPYGE